MDALFSLPVLSVFLMPTFSSYSTSLNLLFFYLTWTTLVLSHPPLRVELIGTTAVRLLFYVLPSLLFFLFDILTPSAAVILKAQGEIGLPGGKKRDRIRRKEIKVAAWALFNVSLSVAVQAAIECFRTMVLGWKSAVRVSVKLPMPWGIVVDLVRGFLGREILTYTIHRYILHSPNSLLSWLTSSHRTWYHSLRAPFPLTAHYDHPLVYLLARFIPTYIPAMLFRFHLVTYLIYLALISIEETFAYSGYTLMPTNFFLGGIARRADMHLLCHGKGNFGPWGVLDWVFGSGLPDREEGDGLEGIVDQGKDIRVKREIDEGAERVIRASSNRGFRERMRKKLSGMGRTKTRTTTKTPRKGRRRKDDDGYGYAYDYYDYDSGPDYVPGYDYL